MDEYASYFENIDPLASYKKWMIGQDGHKEPRSRENVLSNRVQAAFIVSDPVDWSRDIQVSNSPLLFKLHDFFPKIPASHICIFRCDSYLMRIISISLSGTRGKMKHTF